MRTKTGFKTGLRPRFLGPLILLCNLFLLWHPAFNSLAQVWRVRPEFDAWDGAPPKPFGVVPPGVTNLIPAWTVEAGSLVRLPIKAWGTLPLHLQWFFNDATIGTGMTTNSGLVLTSLALTNVQISQSGDYMVVVTNLFGAATSSPTMLNIIPVVDRRLAAMLELQGGGGSLLNVDCNDSLGSPASWLTLDTVSLVSTSQVYFDVTKPLPSQRYYRVWETGMPAVLPSLSPPVMVPAITVTGNIGDSLRLDYINVFGPTNAWNTLGTVTLTNTSQLYFDVASLGQPARLYRIVPTP